MFTLKHLRIVGLCGFVLLAGCGGGGGGSSSGGGSTTLSGTAAGGAAVIGNVLVTDINGKTAGSTIDSTGHYSVDVSGLTAPFVLKAYGTVGNTSVTYYSAATSSDLGGTVDITPFTNLIISNIAAQLAETYFSSPANVASFATTLTPTALANAESSLQSTLAPVLTQMGLSSSISLLHASFSADHTGLDAALDLIKVQPSATTAGSADIVNALNNAVMGTDDPSSGGVTSTLTNTSGLTTTSVTDLSTITTAMNNFAALFATSLPTTTAIANSGLFDTSGAFTMSGKGFSQFALDLTSTSKAIGMKFSNITITPIDSTHAALTAVVSSNSPDFGNTIQLVLAKQASSGAWLIEGDGRIADISIEAQADYWVNESLSGAFQTNTGFDDGLNIYIEPSDYNATHTADPVAKAIVTGPGLPSGGVTLVQDTYNTWYDIQFVSGTQQGNNTLSDCTISTTSPCLTRAGAVDNSQYNVVLEDASGTSLNGTGYTITLAKQPVDPTTLTAANFPALTDFLINGTSVLNGTLPSSTPTSVGATWTMPSGLYAHDLIVWAIDSNGQQYFSVDQSLTVGQTTATIGVSNVNSSVTPANAGLWLAGRDSYKRTFAYNVTVNP